LGNQIRCTGIESRGTGLTVLGSGRLCVEASQEGAAERDFCVLEGKSQWERVKVNPR